MPDLTGAAASLADFMWKNAEDCGALKGNLLCAVEQGVAWALTSHQKLATLVLKSDKQAIVELTDVACDLIWTSKNIDVDVIVGASPPDGASPSLTPPRWRVVPSISSDRRP